MKWWSVLSLEDRTFYISKYLVDKTVTSINEEDVLEMYNKQILYENNSLYIE